MKHCTSTIALILATSCLTTGCSMEVGDAPEQVASSDQQLGASLLPAGQPSFAYVDVDGDGMYSSDLDKPFEAADATTPHSLVFPAGTGIILDAVQLDVGGDITIDGISKCMERSEATSCGAKAGGSIRIASFRGARRNPIVFDAGDDLVLQNAAIKTSGASIILHAGGTVDVYDSQLKAVAKSDSQAATIAVDGGQGVDAEDATFYAKNGKGAASLQITTAGAAHLQNAKLRAAGKKGATSLVRVETGMNLRAEDTEFRARASNDASVVQLRAMGSVVDLRGATIRDATRAELRTINDNAADSAPAVELDVRGFRFYKAKQQERRFCVDNKSLSTLSNGADYLVNSSNMTTTAPCKS